MNDLGFSTYTVIEIDYSAEYPETEAYRGKSPFLFMDIVNSLEEVAWSYREVDETLFAGESNSDEIIEEYFMPLQHASREYFQEYRIEISEDGQVTLEKSYPAEKIEEELSVENIYSNHVIFQVRGNIGQEELQDLASEL